MKYVMIYDNNDIYTPWMLLKVGDDGYITHWAYWGTTTIEVESTEMFPVDAEEPVHLDEIVPRYGSYVEADTYEEVKLLILLEK